MTIKECVKKYSIYLKDITHIPSKEVEILIMYLLEKNAIWLHLNYNSEFSKEKELENLVLKRSKSYPLEYIIGKVSFYGELFLIEEGVLIPRPETEILIDKAREILEPKIQNQKEPLNIVEIGCGSGIISTILALLFDNIKIVCVDINDKALDLAKKNAQRFKVENKIEFLKSNLFEKINIDNIFMLISNPPYIKNSYVLPKNVKFEPSNALFGGENGDEILKQIIKESSKREIPYVLCEMGYDQKAPLEAFFKEFKIESYSFYKDYEGFDRGFTLKFKF